MAFQQSFSNLKLIVLYALSLYMNIVTALCGHPVGCIMCILPLVCLSVCPVWAYNLYGLVTQKQRSA